MSVKIGVQLYPEHTSLDELRAAWKKADELGFDSIWLWDHFFPITGDPGGRHFESYSLLPALAIETTRARFGALATCAAYRNPDLLADVARTLDHLSGGRFILALGAGWYEHDFVEYGYDFGTPRTRLKVLEEALARIEARLTKLNPPPLRRLPILVAGGGEKVTLRLVARYADMWNTIVPPNVFAEKNAVLDDWCRRNGRDPAEIERTILVHGSDIRRAREWVDAGAHHVICGVAHPYDLSDAEELLRDRSR